MATPEAMREALIYNSETGILVWKVRPASHFIDARAQKIFNTQFSGKRAFTKKNKGYYCTSMKGRNYQAHRVAWAIFYGEWPKGEIDHINGDRSDNRIANLRDVDCTTNRRNCGLNSNNTSGRTGVSWNALQCKWVAYIFHERNRLHLGAFAAREDAIAAREAAEREFNYTINSRRAA